MVINLLNFNTMRAMKKQTNERQFKKKEQN